MKGHPKTKDGLFICQECGLEFKSLATHLKKHNINAWEYLLKHNLPGFTDLMGLSTLTKLRQNAHHGHFNSSSNNMNGLFTKNT